LNRTEWLVAWRFARRVMGKWRHDELAAIEAARAELGRPLPLLSSGAALRCRWDRKYAWSDLTAIHRRCADRLGFYDVHD
jgi:hypothetical protein